MRIYESTVEQFKKDVAANLIADLIKQKFEGHCEKHVGDKEYRSWENSSNFLKNVFEIAGLEKNPIILEYQLPWSSQRIDVLVFGSDDKIEDNVVLIELKQWSNKNVDDCESEGNVVVNFGGPKVERPHPSLQVEGYQIHLKDFLDAFSESPELVLYSCVYCHNYRRNDDDAVLFAQKFQPCLIQFPIFSKEDATSLGNLLKSRLSFSDGEKSYSRFVNSPVRPSRKLLEHTRSMIHKQQIFNLIDDQIAAYNAIRQRIKNLSHFKSKSIVIVKGGPGTGKSVIALEIMGELLRKKKTVFHATGSSAFTNTLRKIVGTRAKIFFKFFNSFMDAEANSADVLVCDEAHRIRTISVQRRRRRRPNPVPQIDELIRLAKLCVFFIDEYQIVRPQEIGTVQLIREAAKRFDIPENNIAEFELKTQFRCSGSDAYLQWIDRVLDIRDSEGAVFDPRMKFEILDSPQEVMSRIRVHNAEKKNSARIVAGYCWPWHDPNPDGTLVNDVKIGEFEMPWEQKDDFWKWATEDAGMEQVGTVYTAQGFEFDYIGVIFAQDLSFDEQTQKWEAVPSKSCDKEAKRNNPEFTKHLQSVYRVLLSRAHKGVYVYFMDEGTRKHFEKCRDQK